jgi:dolichyl-phosphate-mannose-protein mannosyltransferase
MCPPPSPRREVVAVLILTAIGAVLRLWSPGQIGLQHFDEGIYALSGLWMLTPGGLPAIDPMVINYAPPGLPILIGLSYVFVGVSDIAAILPALACGIATIPVAGWIGRRTFGPGAGAAAAAFVALSGPHVAFSRMAMTDVPFLLAWLVCLGLGARFLERPGLWRALALGLGVGVAQNFKYNGWLGGIVVGLVAGIELLSYARRDRVQAVRTFGFGAVAALTAALLYWPWYTFVENHGGYSRLVEHHRSYMGGLSQWYPHWKAQMAQAIALSGGPLWLVSAWSLAWLGCAYVVLGPTLSAHRSRVGLSRYRFSLPIGMAIFVCLPDFPWWAGLAGCYWFLSDERPALRILGTSWLLLSILTPFYHPYARLMLPLEAVGWLVMAALVRELAVTSRLAAEVGSTGNEKTMWYGVRARGVVGLLCLALAAWQGLVLTRRASARSDLLAPTDGLRSVVTYLGPELTRTPTPRILMLGRPPLRFYFATKVGVPVQSVENLDELLRTCLPGDIAILDGALLRQEGDANAIVTKVAERWRPIVTLPLPLSPPTLLDINPGAAYGDDDEAGMTSVLVLSPQ